MTLAHKSWIEDITVSLLLKCPAKSLIRFKCVCKSWSTLIHNPEAIGKSILFNAKNKNTNSTTSQLLISRINKNPNPDDTEEPAVFSLCSYNNLHEMSTNQYLPSINSPDHGSATINVVGSCNGIVCLHDHYRDDFFLWNPATGELKILPPPQFQYFNRERRNVIADVILSGFEYLAERKDYKVIKLIRIPTEEYYIELYNLEEDYWKRIDIQGTGIVDFLKNSSMVVNGTLSWFTINCANNEGRITTFDIGKEVFMNTRLPGNSNRFFTFMWFYPLGECLTICVSQWYSRRMEDGWWFDVWVLHEIGVEESWSKLYRIDPNPGLYWCWYPLGFWKDGKVFLDNGKGEMVLYDIDTKQVTDLGIEGVYRTLQIVVYEESKEKIMKESSH